MYATPSIGIALCPDSGDDGERLVKAAEIAMHEASKRGGGRFQYYSESLNTQLAQREELELGLRHALVRDEFILHYQPRIDLASGRLIGLEALLRWQHPRFGLLPPGRFLPILESSGLIHSAGESKDDGNSKRWRLVGSSKFGRWTSSGARQRPDNFAWTDHCCRASGWNE